MPDHQPSKSCMLAAVILASLTGACATLMGESQPEEPVRIGDQNWTPDQRRLWYLGSQGSRLMPERWLRALEAPGSERKLLGAENVGKYNYIDGRYAGSSLPLGFALDQQDDRKLFRTRLRWFDGQSSREPWVGLTCAACHTAQVDYGGNTIIVDGAPALSDFQTLTRDINTAMNDTLAQPAKWDRFAAAVLSAVGPRNSNGDTPANRALLRSAVARWLEQDNVLRGMNWTELDYGYGRLDAVGHILNKSAYLNEAPGQIRGEPDAPVSYPFIWNAPQHDFVQWNGMVPNRKLGPGRRAFDIGALVRNASEVMGVFADVRVTRDASWKGYRSSVDIDNLVAMEAQLGKLMSPTWPSFFPAIDEGKRRRGEQLFKRDCAGCHAPLAANDLVTPIKAEMTPLYGPIPLGTDPWMACNAFTYEAEGGLLSGAPIKVVPLLSRVDGKVRYLPARGTTATYLQAQAAGVLLAEKWRIIRNGLQVWMGRTPVITVPAEPGAPRRAEQLKKEKRLALCENAEAGGESLLAYKARPLNGIWATAPYLHNGSVRSLYQLLLKPEDRLAKFMVGSREYDPVEVGFVDRPGPASRAFTTHDAAGKPIPGNSNRGHYYRDYPDPQDRWALVEYMKGL